MKYSYFFIIACSLLSMTVSRGLPEENIDKTQEIIDLIRAGKFEAVPNIIREVLDQGLELDTRQVDRELNHCRDDAVREAIKSLLRYVWARESRRRQGRSDMLFQFAPQDAVQNRAQEATGGSAPAGVLAVVSPQNLSSSSSSSSSTPQLRSAADLAIAFAAVTFAWRLAFGLPINGVK